MLTHSKTFMKSKFFSLLGGGTVTMIVVTVLALSDMLIAGIRVGENAVAAVNLIVPVYSFAGFCGCIVSLGVPIMYTRKMGQFKKDEADRIFGTGFTFSIIIGAILFVVLLGFGDMYLKFYGASGAVTELAKPYFFWYKLIALQMPLAALMLEMVIADGNELLSTVSGAVQFVSNILLSVILSGTMGLAGIGLASFIANYLGLGILFLHFLRKSCSLKISFQLSGKLLLNVAKYSIIDSGVYLFLSLFSFVMNKFVLVHFGAQYLVLVSAIVTIKDLELLFDGIGEAMSPIMNIYLNEKSYDGVRNCYKLSAKVAAAEGVFMTAALLIAAPLLVRALGIETPDISAYAVWGIRIMALGYSGVSLIFLLTSYYLVRNKIALGFTIVTLANFIIPAAASILLSLALGILGLFAGICISPYITLLISAVLIIRKYGKENFPLIIAEEERNTVSVLYELELTPENIIELQKKAEKYLAEHGRDSRHIGKVKLLIEDMLMLVYDKNTKPVLGECLLTLEGDGERIIIKDDGALFALTEDDAAVSTLGSYTVANYMSNMEKMYLTTMSYNRNVFYVE